MHKLISLVVENDIKCMFSTNGDEAYLSDPEVLVYINKSLNAVYLPTSHTESLKSILVDILDPLYMYSQLAVSLLQRLALCAGVALDIDGHEHVKIASSGSPEVSNGKSYKFNGFVYCIEVPNHIFYIRRNNKCCWTGNSSRSGNKSIVASILPHSDMPFTESGITPDIIINTHSQPTRMTVGQLVETAVSKMCTKKGVTTDGTTFLPIDHELAIKELLECGFRFNGRERMYNGMTGEYFDSAIFIGPTFEQRLQKFVIDDEQSVPGNGPTDATTGQPLGGKALQGGLRIGEMEGWGLDSHGSMMNMYEKLSQDSDGRTVYICRNCGNYGVYNRQKSIYICKTCKELADLSAVESTKSSVLCVEEINASNIKIIMGLAPREFEKTE